MSGEIDITPGRVLGDVELVDNAKLNQLGQPVLRIKEGAITTRELADGQITADKLDVNLSAQLGVADNAVTTAKLVDGAVTTAKLAEDAVTAEKLAADAIHGQALVTSLADADEAIFYRAVDGALVRISRANLINALMPVGSVLQTVVRSDANYTTTTTQLPSTTFPSIFGGSKITALDLVITPRSASNKIELDLYIPFVSSAAGTTVSFAIFRNNTLVAVGGRYTSSTTNHGAFSLKYVDAPASVLELSYTVYFGPDTATTARLLGEAGPGALWSMQSKMQFVAREIKG